MKFAKYLIGIIAVAFSASSHATLILEEGFDRVATLAASGWTLQNSSTPTPGDAWFQGNSGIFVSQTGAADAYIGSNYLAAPAGGLINNLLITPYFSLETAVSLTFWARGDVLDGFADTFKILGGSTANGGPEVIAELLGPTVVVGDWTQFTVLLGGQGAGAQGRFTFEYAGFADSSNYIGFDTVSVSTVPEPSTFALLALGLAGMALARRRQRRF